jgi:type I restriction enzyme S subunit
VKQLDLAIPAKEEKQALPPSWRRVKLGEVCEINPRRPNDLNRADEGVTSFVPMPAVDARSGVILNRETRSFGEVKNGYTYFEEGDVLFAKITPCMQNGKHAIATGLIGGFGFGTTEFHVLRPDSEILSNWIHQFLRQPEILRSAIAYFTGAVGQQRIPPSFLYNLQIPLPPVPEQKRIAALLAEQMEAVERARAAAQTQLDAAKALPAAYLRVVFNSPEAQKWPKSRMGEVCIITMGQSPVGNSYNTKGEGEPLLNGPTEFGPTYPTPIQWTTQPTRFAEKGDILVCVRGATTGRKNIANQRYCIGRGLAAIRGKLGKISTDFLLYVLDIITLSLLGEASGSTFPNLPGAKLEKFEIPLPPIDQQHGLTEILKNELDKAQHMQRTIKEQLDTIDKIPAALLRRAFNGEL